MGSAKGNYSRNLFDENKRYVQRRVQQGIPWVDADDNDLEQGHYNMLRRVQQLFGNGAVREGFRCIGTGAANDFTIKGGGGTAETAGRFFLEGHGCLLYSDTQYKNDGSVEDGRSIQPRITAIEYQSGSNTTLVTDSAANWGANEHQGKVVTPDITQPAASYVVQSNTQTQMVLNGDATAVAHVGDHYRIELHTPTGGDRIDGVFLNVYLDEYDCEDDPNLLHNLSTQVCAQLRMKLIQNIYVKEGSESFPSYVDNDGNQHYTLQIARLHRKNGQNEIYTHEVDDLRDILQSEDWESMGMSDLMRLIMNLKPVVADPPTDKISILPGFWTVSDRSAIRQLVARTDSMSIPGITTIGMVRYDLISIADNGTLHRKVGSEVAAPGNPFTDGPEPELDKLALAYVRVSTIGTPTIAKDDITDVREFLNLGGGVQDEAVARFIYNNANPANPFLIGNDPSDKYIMEYDAGTNQVLWVPNAGGTGGGVLACHHVNGLSVGTTLINLPFEYDIGTCSLLVFRNGAHQVLTLDYTETSNVSITLLDPVEGPEEDFFIIKIASTEISTGNVGILQSHVVSSMSVGQTLIALPWTYDLGQKQLLVFRNGVFQVLPSDYTETSTSSITLVNPIQNTSEEVVVLRIASTTTLKGSIEIEDSGTPVGDALILEFGDGLVVTNMGGGRFKIDVVP